MHISEDVMLLMARERLDEAMRQVDRLRALRLARGPQPPMRIRLGMALIRFGHRIIGQPSSGPGAPIALRRTQS